MTDLITEPSICIPRTLNSVTWRDVKDVFEKLFGKGTVERVDIVRRRDDNSPFCRIFVHMRYWPVNIAEVATWRDKLLAGETLKVVYDQPWYWKCAASRMPKPVRERVSTRPYIISEQVTPPPPSPRKAGDQEMSVEDSRYELGDEAEPQSSGEQAGEAREAEIEAQEQEDM